MDDSYLCNTCKTYLYSETDEAHDEIYYICPKCEYEDLPRHMRERCAEFRKKDIICEHFNWKDHCKACDTWNPAYNPQGYTGWNDPKRIGKKE